MKDVVESFLQWGLEGERTLGGLLGKKRGMVGDDEDIGEMVRRD